MNASDLLPLSLLLIFIFSTVSGDGGIIPALQLAASAVKISINMRDKFRNGAVRIEDITSEMKKLQMEMKGIKRENTNAIVNDLVNRLIRDPRVKLQLNELSMHISEINLAKKRFAEYVKDPKLTEKVKLEDFARQCISHNSSSIFKLMETIQSIITPVSDSGLINPGVHAVVLDALKVIRSEFES